MAKASSKITDEQIEAKRDIFLLTIEKEKEVSRDGRTSQIQIFLDKIKDLIKIALDDGLSHKQIAKTIFTTWNVKVSDQTIRRFAENTLGIKKERKEKVTTTNASITPVTKTDETSISKPAAVEATKEISKPLQTDGIKHKPAKFDDI